MRQPFAFVAGSSASALMLALSTFWLSAFCCVSLEGCACAVRANLDPNGGPVIGFSATTTIQRSQWGMDTLVPYIGDEVDVAIEAEFVAPAM